MNARKVEELRKFIDNEKRKFDVRGKNGDYDCWCMLHSLGGKLIKASIYRDFPLGEIDGIIETLGIAIKAIKARIQEEIVHIEIEKSHWFFGNAEPHRIKRDNFVAVLHVFEDAEEELARIRDWN